MSLPPSPRLEWDGQNLWAVTDAGRTNLTPPGPRLKGWRLILRRLFAALGRWSG